MDNEHEYKNVINLILHKIIWISNDPGNKKNGIAKSLLNMEIKMKKNLLKKMPHIMHNFYLAILNKNRMK